MTSRTSRAPDPVKLADFTATTRLFLTSALAIIIGSVSALLAYALLRLIALFTNIFYFQRFAFDAHSPAEHSLGYMSVLVPVGGALIIGVMARYGSERIRGHGIPEAIEAILIRGSRVEPKVALLKPVSSAISIGSGGPFGAEGPIIMTGGAFGSIVAQLFKLTAAERKTLLVAGAAAGMSATFASPLAAILLAVELLLFEWKPRSFVPVALASATAAIARQFILGAGPIFPIPPHSGFVGVPALLCCALAGLGSGALSGLLTVAVYAFEDLFARLTIHWMWWPAIGGLAIGIGGLICPSALGVGYDTIEALLRESPGLKFVVMLMIVKSTIWAVSLGSGTSGGVLAPLLMMGGALGAIEAHVFPHAGTGFWPLISMAAILGGTMRAPLTGIVFAVELTHDFDMFLPLMIAVTVAHAFTVLVLRRSILTEKVARRGFHISREYAVDALEVLFVRDVMNTQPQPLDADGSLRDALALAGQHRKEQLFPLLDRDAKLVGAASHDELLEWATDPEKLDRGVRELARRKLDILFSNETLRTAAYRMAEHGALHFLVVNPADATRLVGRIGLQDLLKARSRHLEEEQRRERVLPWQYILPAWIRPPSSEP